MKIITHTGEAHRDDLLSVALLLAAYGDQVSAVCRVAQVPANTGPEDYIVDIGGKAEGRWMDHHQLSSSGTPTCALSLVLRHLGIYAEARRCWPWLEYTEHMDVHGPQKTATWLGLPGGSAVFRPLLSPVEAALLRSFGRQSQVLPGDALWAGLRLVGGELLDQLHAFAERMRWLQAHARFWELDGQRLGIVVADPELRTEPKLVLAQFKQAAAPDAAFAVVPDSRGPGWAILRLDDDPRFDFSRCAGHPQVLFAHPGGFLVTTMSLPIDQLLSPAGVLAELIQLARVSCTGQDLSVNRSSGHIVTTPLITTEYDSSAVLGGLTSSRT